MILYLPSAKDEMTRLMGPERWHHNHPTNVMILSGARKDALRGCCPHSSTWLLSHFQGR